MRFLRFRLGGSRWKNCLGMRMTGRRQRAFWKCALYMRRSARVWSAHASLQARPHVDSCLQPGQDAGQPAAFDPPRPEQGGSSAGAGRAETGQTNKAGAPGGAPRARAKGWVTWKENGKIMLAERQGAPSLEVGESDDEAI